MFKFLLSTITALTLVTAPLSATPNLADNAFKPFQANYKVFRKGSELGEAYRKLINKNGSYILETDSKISWMFLSDSRHEISNFSLENDQIIPISYQYNRTGTGRDRKTNTIFSQPTISSNYKSKNYKFEHHSDILDPQLYQLAMQQQLITGKTEFSFPLIKRGKLVDYRFKVVGHEQLTLPYGKLNTLKLERIRKSSSRKTLMWVAPSLNYTMVKLTQFKKGKEQADLQLSWLKFEQ